METVLLEVDFVMETKVLGLGSKGTTEKDLRDSLKAGVLCDDDR
jgi:hypothetical protein